MEREVTLASEESAGHVWIIRLLMMTHLAESKREARQLIARGMIFVDGSKITSPDIEFPLHEGLVVKKGEQEGVKLRLSL
jgi:ribosomal protein S4